MTNTKLEQIIDKFHFVPQNSASFQMRDLTIEEQSFFGAEKLLDLDKNQEQPNVNEITFLVKNSTNLNGELVIRWVGCDDRAWDTYLVEYDGKECSSFSVTVGSRVSMVQSEDSSVQIVVAKATQEEGGVRINAVICMHTREHESSNRFDGEVMPDGLNIYAFKNIDLSESELLALSSHLGAWITKKLPKTTRQDIDAIFFGLYQNIDIGNALEKEIPISQFEEEVSLFDKGELDLDTCSEFALSYLLAVDLAQKGYAIFAGPYTLRDELALDYVNFALLVRGEEGESGIFSFHTKPLETARTNKTNSVGSKVAVETSLQHVEQADERYDDLVRFDGANMPEYPNIFAFKNVDLTPYELEEFVRLLGPWVKKDIAPLSQEEIEKLFKSIKEKYQYRSWGENPVEQGLEIALNLSSRGYVIFTGPFTGSDELCFDNTNYICLFREDPYDINNRTVKLYDSYIHDYGLPRKENQIVHGEEFVMQGNKLVQYKGNSRHIVIPSNVQVIGENTFEKGKMVSVIIPNTVKEIEKYAFYKCERLKSVQIDAQLTQLAGGMFQCCTSLEIINLPDSIKTFCEDCFCSCSKLEYIHWPSKLTKIEQGAFSSCKSLTRVEIPDSVKNMGNGVFHLCENLQLIKLGRGLKKLNDIFSSYEDGCFWAGKNKIEHLIIPSNIIDIKRPVMDGNIFKSLPNLKRLEFEEGTFSIDLDDYYGTSFEEIVIPESVIHIRGIYSETIFCKNGSYAHRYARNNKVKHIVAGEMQTTPNPFWIVDGELRMYAGNDATVVIPNGVKKIRELAFGEARFIKELVIPEGVKIIGKNLFCTNPRTTSWTDNCVIELEKLVLPSTLEEIQEYAFGGCVNLRELSLPSSLKIIGENAFRNHNINRLFIPKSIEDLGYGVFATKSIIDIIEFEAGSESVSLSQDYDYSKWNRLVIPASVQKIDIEYSYDCKPTVFCEPKSKAESWAKRRRLPCKPISRDMVDGYSISTNDDEFIYEQMSDGNIAIDEYRGANPCVVIPSEIDGKIVTEIHNIASPNAMQSVRIEELTIPASIKVISADGGFEYLKKVNYLGTIDQWVQIDFNEKLFFAKGNILTICGEPLPGQLVITAPIVKKNSFSYSEAVTEVVFENSVSEIQNAFSHCVNLRSVVLPQNNECAVDICAWDESAIKTLEISANIRLVSSETYRDGFKLAKLSKVVFGEGAKVIPGELFAFCPALKRIVIPNSIEAVGDLSTVEYGYQKLLFTEDGQYRYLGNKNNPYLVLVTVDKSISKIDEIHPNCKVICHNAFDNAENVKEIIIPDGFTQVDFEWNYSWKKAISLLLGKNVRTIDSELICKCAEGLIKLTISSDNPYYIKQNNCLVDVALKEIVLAYKGARISPDIMSIGNHAFYQYKGKGTLEIPSNVEEIKYRAFSESTFENVQLYPTLKKIDDFAFFKMPNLVSPIQFNGTREQWNNLIDFSIQLPVVCLKEPDEFLSKVCVHVVTVKLANKKTYKCNCAYDVKVGDIVTYKNASEEGTGEATLIEDRWVYRSTMKHIVSVIRK